MAYSSTPNIEVHNFQIESVELRIGESLTFSFEIKAKKDEALMVDYVLYFQTKTGKLSPKVHKIKKFNIQKNKPVNISKKHPFRVNMTTRKLYAGEHRLVLQINGQTYGEVAFDLYV